MSKFMDKDHLIETSARAVVFDEGGR